MSLVAMPTVKEYAVEIRERFLATGPDCVLLLDGEDLRIQRTNFQWAKNVKAPWLKDAKTVLAAFSPNGEYCAVLCEGWLELYFSKNMEPVSNVDFDRNSKRKFLCVAVSDDGITAIGTDGGRILLHGKDGVNLVEGELSTLRPPIVSCAFVGSVLYAKTGLGKSLRTVLDVPND